MAGSFHTAARLSASWTTPWFAPRCGRDRKSTRLNSSHGYISYAVFCLKKKKKRFGLDRNSTHLNSIIGYTSYADFSFKLKDDYVSCFAHVRCDVVRAVAAGDICFDTAH